MWYESDLDALMTRTCLRPIPMGKVNKKQALNFWNFTFIFFSNCTGLFCKYNFCSTIIIYNFILCICLHNLVKEKNTSKYCNWRGGRSTTTCNWLDNSNKFNVSIEPITFFLIIFFWTPSHFWALSLYKSDDYKKAKIPMLPLTNGIESTKINIFVYSLLMLPMIILPYAIKFWWDWCS